MTASWEQQLARIAPGSGAAAREASRVIAGGTTHPLRDLSPFPISIARAAGSRKWDVDGNEYVDYVVGHGALLLGHAYPTVASAVAGQAGRGTHYGGAHPAETEWARLVCDLVPSAERVRFTSSGTEAVMLAVRLARAYTGRTTVVKLQGHFHGWSEIGLVGLSPPYDALPPGLPPASAGDVVALPPDGSDVVEERLSQGDVAAFILEPSGAHFGQVPLTPELLHELRTITSRHDVLLVFDEVVTGFRWAVGGAQERYAVTPDLTTLAKILGGGLPAGAVAGPQDIMALFGPPAEGPRAALFHPGTFNANPLSAAAGIATLREVSSGRPTGRADAQAATLRNALNAALQSAGVAGLVYGTASDFHIFLGEVPEGDGRTAALKGMRGPVGSALRGAMLARGIDLMGPGGMLSCVHTDADLERTVEAFDGAVREVVAARIR